MRFIFVFVLLALSAHGQDQGSAESAAIQRIAFGSCADENKAQPIWKTIGESRPDLFIFAGDNVYNDTEDPKRMKANWAKLSSVAGFAKLRASVSILGTWDDHDYGANDAGREFAQREVSQQLFLDFLGLPKDAPRRQRAGVYHAEIFGPPGRRVQVILLDTRFHRSPLKTAIRNSRRVYVPENSRDATMLGEEQWGWLEARLREPADLRFIVSSIQLVAEEHRFEKWSNLPRERRRLLRLIDSCEAKGVLFLSGDRHLAELSRLRRSGGYPLYELTASGLNQSEPRRGSGRAPEPNRHRLGRIFRGHHFGLIEIDWESVDPQLTLAILNQKGERPIERRLSLSELGLPPRPRSLDQSGPVRAAAKKDSVVLRADGRLEDWQGNAALAQSDSRLFVRLDLEEQRSLGTADSCIELRFDLDGDTTTGDRRSPKGADLSIEFSPLVPEGQRRNWRPRLKRFDERGKAREIASEEVGLVYAPTHASSHFEVAVDRRAAGLRGSGVDKAGRVELRVLERSAEPSSSRLLIHESAKLSALSKSSTKAPRSLPAKEKGALRLLSYNVLWGTPSQTPEPFSRILRALRPDIVFLQEWDGDHGEADLIAWFKTHVDERTNWQATVAMSGARGSGVAIVSRFPIKLRGPRELPLEGGGWDFPMRAACALIETPMGVLLASGVHLKAAGSLDSAEDQRRRIEARALNFLLKGMALAQPPEFCVVAGDFNLVGGAEILELATRGLDRDGSGLKPALPAQLGDPALVYTHGRRGPWSRLDYLCYSESVAELGARFVLDTRLLSDELLRREGLRRDDAIASDHFPLVVDLKALR